jgi:hypothetical protein
MQECWHFSPLRRSPALRLSLRATFGCLLFGLLLMRLLGLVVRAVILVRLSGGS